MSKKLYVPHKNESALIIIYNLLIVPFWIAIISGWWTAMSWSVITSKNIEHWGTVNQISEKLMEFYLMSWLAFTIIFGIGIPLGIILYSTLSGILPIFVTEVRAETPTDLRAK